MLVVCSRHSSVRLGEDVPGNFVIALVTVKPLPAGEDCGDAGSHVGDLHPVQEPARTEAAVVMLDVDLGQLAWNKDGTDCQLNRNHKKAGKLKE